QARMSPQKENVMRKHLAAAVLFVAVLGVGCGKKEAPAPPPPAPEPTMAPTPTPGPLAVGTVTLGNAVGADKKVAAPMEAFGVKDKIYASVSTTGQGHGKIRGLWSFIKGGKTAKVNETVMEFDASGPATNEFHIENKKDWPKGDYQVEIFLGDAATPAATKSFKVQ
ncbi:MAG TPA: hypothetical protein VGR00_06630, partial [Thermoanaerobaculia bacterium]|nr:hypothetical protein [Thermoanaerobaculia bacterium]